MTKTFSATSVATLIFLFKNGYSFADVIDMQLDAIDSGIIKLDADETIDIYLPDEAAMDNLMHMVCAAVDDELLKGDRPQIEALIENLKLNQTPAVTLTADEMTVLCMLHITHGLLGILADAVIDAMNEFKEGIPADAGEFVLEDIEEENAVDIITAIYEAEKNKSFAECLPVLDNLKDKFAQFCRVVPEPNEDPEDLV